MIRTREDLKRCIAIDAQNFPKRNGSFVRNLINALACSPISQQTAIWNYIKELRYNEYYFNKLRGTTPPPRNIFTKFVLTVLWLKSNRRLNNLAYKTGFQIPPNTIDEGLMIFHWGSIVVNPQTKIGKYCTLSPNVLFAHKGNGAPVVGDNVYVGNGAKIIGSIHIGNNVTIAPNAVVTHDVLDNAIVGGVPAKIIKFKEYKI